MRFVLDASVTLSWLLRDTAPRDQAYPLAVLNSLRDPDTVAMVPTTWRLEVANVIARSPFRYPAAVTTLSAVVLRRMPCATAAR
jgi:hypothetical protein